MKTENIIFAVFKYCVLALIIGFTFAGCGNNSADNDISSADKTETKNIDAYIALVDEYNEGISVIALSINKYLSDHADFKNKEDTGKLIENAKNLVDKIKSTIDEANKLNDADSKLQKQLIKCLELEATRIDGLYMGMKNSQEGKDFSPDFKRGGIAAEEFEKEHKILLRMARPKENFDDDDLSLGGISLNDTPSKIKSILGKPIGESTTDNNELIQGYDKLKVTISKNKIQKIDSFSEDVETSRGIHEQSTISELIVAYGNNYSITEEKDDNGKILWNTYSYTMTDKEGNPCELQFLVYNGKDKISEITIVRLSDKQLHNKISIGQKDKLHPEHIKPTVNGGARGNGYRYFVVTSYVCRYCGEVETLAEYSDDIMMISPRHTNCPNSSSGEHSGTVWYFNSFMYTDDQEVWGNTIPGEWKELNNEINHRAEMESVTRSR